MKTFYRAEVAQNEEGGGLNELALFAGAGGGILGGHLLGWRTVCAVEYNAYARSVLLARQNDGTLPPFPVWDDVRTFDGRPWRGCC
jgi:DNA (cytosine-5)-methyltransferase 1